MEVKKSTITYKFTCSLKLRIAEIHLTSLPLTHVINAQQKHLVKEIMMNTFLSVSECIIIFTGNNNKQICTLYINISCFSLLYTVFFFSTAVCLGKTVLQTPDILIKNQDESALIICTHYRAITEYYGTNKIQTRFKVQGSLLFVTYTIIQGIISSEM